MRMRGAIVCEPCMDKGHGFLYNTNKEQSGGGTPALLENCSKLREAV